MTRLLGLVVGLALAPAAGALAADFAVDPHTVAEVVVTGIPRPLQIAFGPEGSLLVLSQGPLGDAATEIVTVVVDDPRPADGAGLPRAVIPFADEARKTVLGSLAVNPRTGEVALGEENGNRIYRLHGGQLLPLVSGLNHLVGGSAMAFDADGRLVIVDFVSPETQLRAESRPPPALEWLAGEGYQGPLVFRLDLGEDRPLPRRADLATPFFPGGGARAEPLPSPRFVSVAASPGGDLVLLDSLGQVTRLTADGQLHLLANLGSGHYHRTNMAVGADGTVVVSTGFHIRRLLKISPGGHVATIAWDLGDPNGLAIDRAGAIYLAETAHHRILRFRTAAPVRPPPPSPR